MESSVALLPVPSAARGYMKYVVVMDPVENVLYSIGISHALDTRGGRKYVRRLMRNLFSNRKRHIQGQLCPSVLTDTACAYAAACECIHVTQEGWSTRRLWCKSRAMQSASPTADQPAAPAAPTLAHSPVAFDSLIPSVGVPLMPSAAATSPLAQLRPTVAQPPPPTPPAPPHPLLQSMAAVYGARRPQVPVALPSQAPPPVTPAYARTAAPAPVPTEPTIPPAVAALYYQLVTSWLENFARMESSQRAAAEPMTDLSSLYLPLPRQTSPVGQMQPISRPSAPGGWYGAF